jgi:CRISPR-associated endonuclease/helicase Cas3
MEGLAVAEPWAHSGGHVLADHLKAVAAGAAEFSSHFDAAESALRWAWLAGQWHDLGKYRPGFQKYVRLADDPDAHIEGKVAGREKTHSAAGALWAMQRLNQKDRPYGHILAYLIAGHRSRK